MGEKWKYWGGGEVPLRQGDFVDVDWMDGLMSQQLPVSMVDWDRDFFLYRKSMSSPSQAILADKEES